MNILIKDKIKRMRRIDNTTAGVWYIADEMEYYHCFQQTNDSVRK